jgi:hypothetical protein
MTEDVRIHQWPDFTDPDNPIVTPKVYEQYPDAHKTSIPLDIVAIAQAQRIEAHRKVVARANRWPWRWLKRNRLSPEVQLLCSNQFDPGCWSGRIVHSQPSDSVE